MIITWQSLSSYQEKTKGFSYELPSNENKLVWSDKESNEGGSWEEYFVIWDRFFGILFGDAPILVYIVVTEEIE